MSVPGTAPAADPRDPAAWPVLLVDDERPALASAELLLCSNGIGAVATLGDSNALLPWLAAHKASLLMLDLHMPGLSGQELLARVAELHPELPVIVMTAERELDTVVACMQAGAIDYLLKPVETQRMLSAVRRGREMRALRSEVQSLKDSLLDPQPRQHEAFAEILTGDPAMRAIFRYLEAIAPSSHPVLVTGQTGTGKDLVAKAIHGISGRRGKYVPVNAAEYDDQFLADALFGHVRGAFATAVADRPGGLAEAALGSLFLDEIGDVSLVNQAKLLRLLNDGSYYKLGSDRLQRSQARIIAATNRDLVKDVKEGRFRQDLLARLRAHHLHLPPLRARSGDVARLVPIFVDRAAQELNKPAPHVSPALLQHLQAQAWPENVRGLWYACLDAVACHDGGALTRRHFRLAQDGPTAAEPAPAAANGRASWIPDVLPTLSEARDALIAEALRRTGGNQTVAASLLGMQRGTLNRWLVRRRGADANTDPSDFEENP